MWSNCPFQIIYYYRFIEIQPVAASRASYALDEIEPSSNSNKNEPWITWLLS